jgi:hypothetical protein
MDQAQIVAAFAAYQKASEILRTREAELEAARDAETEANIALDTNESDAALKKAAAALVKRQSKERLAKQALENCERTKDAHAKAVRQRAEAALEAERAKLARWHTALDPLVAEVIELNARLYDLVVRGAGVVDEGQKLHGEFMRHARELGIEGGAVEPNMNDARRYFRDALTAVRERDGIADVTPWMVSVPLAHRELDDSSIARLEGKAAS